jgi:PAS domain S-box-containing protein
MKRAKKQEDRLMIEFERRKSHFTGFDFNHFIIPAWIMIVTGSLIWNWNHIQSDFIDIANANARMSLEKDLNYRRWASMHGGVYVPVTEDTPPNPYLVHLPDRDIMGPDGRMLTLMNPAYMNRQVYEMFAEKTLLHVYITSLKPLRPENSPDQWEKNALMAFNEGRSEVSGIHLMNNKPFYRLMRPIITEAECLKCHQAQGYQTGDIRGGLSVAVPMTLFFERIRHQRTVMSITHILVGGLVMIGLITGMRKLKDEYKSGQNLLKRYELIMEGAAGGIWDWDVTKKQVYFSPVWKAMRGYRKDELTNSETEWSDSIHPDDKDRVMAAVKEHFEGESEVFNQAYRIRRKDGSWICIRDRGKALRDDTGRMIRMAGSEVDITEYVKARNELEQSEQRYRSLAEVSPAGIWQTDETGDNTFVSHRWVEITGISKEKAAGRGWAQRIHPDDKEKIRSGWYRHASSRQPYRSEFRFIRPDGSTVWVLCMARPQRDEKGEVIGWIGNITDITKLKESEAENESLIRSLRTALAQIKTLNQLLPICASCKKIRDDKGYWNQIETYISEHSQAQFSHSICPDCTKELYPDLDIY